MPDQVIGVRDVLVAGVQLDEALHGPDRLLVLVGLVVGVGRHHLAAGRPLRVGVLALDLLERLRGLAEIRLREVALALAVELLRRAVRQLGIVDRVPAQPANRQASTPRICREALRSRQRRWRKRPRTHRHDPCPGEDPLACPPARRLAAQTGAWATTTPDGAEDSQATATSPACRPLQAIPSIVFRSGRHSSRAAPDGGRRRRRR